MLHPAGEDATSAERRGRRVSRDHWMEPERVTVFWMRKVPPLLEAP